MSLIDISDNEYYIRWSFEYHIYRYDKSNRTDPRNVSYLDISYNNGISPYTYFDFTEYGKIYKPKPIIMTYRRIEYPNAPKTYYKNLMLTNLQKINLSTHYYYRTSYSKLSLHLNSIKLIISHRNSSDCPIDFQFQHVIYCWQTKA